MSVSVTQSEPSDTLDSFKLPSHRFTVSMIVMFVIGIVGVCILLMQLHYDAIYDVANRNLRNFILLENQFNQKLLTDLDDVITVLANDLQEAELDADEFLHNYHTLINDRSIFQTLLILDADGRVIHDSRPEQPFWGNDLTDELFYAVHTGERSDKFVIHPPIQSSVDNHWSVLLSRGIWDDSGNLSQVFVVSASSLIWSRSLNELNSSDEYIGILTREDGIVLTTFPYMDALIGTQLSETQFSSAMDNRSDVDILPSFINGQSTLIQMQSLESAPATLIIERLNIDALVQMDNVGIIITWIAFATLICGIAILVLYLRQHHALQLQTDNLQQINTKLQKDIQSRRQIENSLRDSEELYRMVTNLISDYAYSVKVAKDRQFSFDWITPSFYTMTGYTPEIFNEDFLHESRIHPDYQELIRQNTELNFLGQDTITEYQYRIQSGDYIWIRVKRRPIWDEVEGRVVRIIGAVTDITTEKEAEFALRESEERYRIISELISDGAFMINVLPDGRFEPKWLTDPLLRDTDYTQEDIPKYLPIDFTVHPDDIAQIEEDMKCVLAGETVTSEYRSRMKNGVYRWMQTTRKPLWDEVEGRVVSYYGVSRNINVRKEAEIALRKSEERYRMISEMMSGYAYSSVVHEDGTISREWLTDSFYTMSGYDKEAAYLEYAADRRAHPDFVEMLANDMERTLQGEETVSEYRWRVQSGDYIWLRVKRRPIWNADHTRVIRIICAGSDITIEKEAEIAIRENEQRYREISELMSDYASSTRILDDGSSEVEWLIGSLEQITGIPPQETYNSTGYLLKTLHPDDAERVNNDRQQTIQGHKTISEFRIIHAKTQEIRWLQVTRQPIWNEEHTRIVRIMGGVTDITAQKEAEIALRINEERYRTLTDLMSDYVYSLTVDANNMFEMDWFAGSFEKITGVHLDDYVVNSQQDMIKGAHDIDRETSLSDLDKTFSGEPTVSEYRITHAVDQSLRWLRASRFPVVDDKTGQVTRILGAVTDITDQKMVETALRDSEERYRQLTELLTDYAFSIRVDDDGRLYREWLVGDFEAINGYSITPVGYFDTPELRRSPNDDLKRVLPHIQRTLQGEATVDEYEIINQKDNKPRWIRVTRQPIWNPDHTRVIRYIGAVKEITVEKEAEFMNREAAELRQALDYEKGLHELRSRFVAMVTHEFRNPLAAIQSSTYILQKYNDRISDESRQEKFDRIYGQIDRLTNLLEDLLKAGELEHHVLRFSSEEIDIVALMNELYIEYQDSIGRDHHLVLESDHDTILMNGDSYLLQQTLGNIISNAIKYSPINSDVVCRITEEEQQVVIQVIDHGVGIPEKEYDELFKAFYRASNVSTQPGTGLGLLIAQQAIELHRGTITFTSTMGKGTTFTITLPRGNITTADDSLE